MKWRFLQKKYEPKESERKISYNCRILVVNIKGVSYSFYFELKSIDVIYCWLDSFMCVALFESCPDKSVADKKDKIVYQGEGIAKQMNSFDC